MADQQTQNSTLFDLSEVEKPEHIRVDGVEYALATWDDFTVVEYHRLQRAGFRLGELMQVSDRDLTEEEEGELQQRADYLFDTITPDMPLDVREKIKPGQRLQVALAFFGKGVPEKLAGAQPQTAPGKNTSRRSKGSSAAGRKTG